MQGCDDCAIWKWKLLSAVGFDRRIIAQDGCEAVEVALLVGNGDQFLVAVSVGNLRYEYRCGLLIGVERCEPG